MASNTFFLKSSDFEKILSQGTEDAGTETYCSVSKLPCGPANNLMGFPYWEAVYPYNIWISKEKIYVR